MGVNYFGQPYFAEYSSITAPLVIGDSVNVWPLTREELLAIVDMMRQNAY